MRVAFDEGVHEDLDNIELFIAQDSIDKAIAFSNELVEQAYKIAAFPWKHEKISDSFEEKYRQYHYKGYTIYYKVEESEIVILEIFQDSKQDHRLKPVK